MANSRLTEEKRPHERGYKGLKESETIKYPSDPLNASYTGNTQAEITEVENKKVLPTEILLNTFIRNLKRGEHTLESKAQSDKSLIKFLTSIKGFEMTEEEKSDLERTIHENEPPINNNFAYTFTDDTYAPVRFSITKLGRVYGFCRDDTGEYGNFTIIKTKSGGFTFKVQPLDEINLPINARGW